MTRVLRARLASLGSVYSAFFSALTMFAGFWVVVIVYAQLTDPKAKSITVFPSGLTDATTLLPLALLAFSGLLFAAQQSVKEDTALRGLYGYAARSMMNAFYFLALSLVLGLGSRVTSPSSFDKIWLIGSLLHQLALLTSPFVWISGLVGGAFTVGGLVAFSRSFRYHTN